MSPIQIAILLVLLGSLAGITGTLGYYVGQNENLDEIQKKMSIIIPILCAIYLILYMLLYYWVQAEPQIMLPLFMVLSCINSIISTSSLGVSILTKQ